MRQSDRTINLQHTRHTIGDIVEAVSWPYPVDADLTLPTGEVRKVALPAGTAYLGAIIRPQFWPLYKKGLISGWSMEGSSRRVEVDIDPGVLTVTAPTPYSPTAKRKSPMSAQPGPPDPKAQGILQGIGAKLSLGTPDIDTPSATSYTFTSPVPRYSTDVNATIDELRAVGYQPLGSTNSWVEGGEGVTTRWQAPSGAMLDVTHHTPESYHRSRKSTIPPGAHRLAVRPLPGTGMGGMWGGPGASAGITTTVPLDEGAYWGQGGVIAGSPPPGSV